MSGVVLNQALSGRNASRAAACAVAELDELGYRPRRRGSRLRGAQDADRRRAVDDPAWREHRGIEKGEDRRADANREAEPRDGHRHHPRTAPEQPQRIRQVLDNFRKRMAGRRKRRLTRARRKRTPETDDVTVVPAAGVAGAPSGAPCGEQLEQVRFDVVAALPSGRSRNSQRANLGGAGRVTTAGLGRSTPRFSRGRDAPRAPS